MIDRLSLYERYLPSPHATLSFSCRRRFFSLLASSICYIVELIGNLVTSLYSAHQEHETLYLSFRFSI